LSQPNLTFPKNSFVPLRSGTSNRNFPESKPLKNKYSYNQLIKKAFRVENSMDKVIGSNSEKASWSFNNTKTSMWSTNSISNFPKQHPKKNVAGLRNTEKLFIIMFFMEKERWQAIKGRGVGQEAFSNFFPLSRTHTFHCNHYFGELCFRCKET
jgi:hypothetical protein